MTEEDYKIAIKEKAFWDKLLPKEPGWKLHGWSGKFRATFISPEGIYCDVDPRVLCAYNGLNYKTELNSG